MSPQQKRGLPSINTKRKNQMRKEKLELELTRFDAYLSAQSRRTPVDLRVRGWLVSVGPG